MPGKVEIIDKYEIGDKKIKKCEFTGQPVHWVDKRGVRYRCCPACRKYLPEDDTNFDRKNKQKKKACKLCKPHERGRQKWNKECRKGLHPGKKGTMREYIEMIWSEEIDDPIKHKGVIIPIWEEKNPVRVDVFVPDLEDNDD